MDRKQLAINLARVQATLENYPAHLIAVTKFVDAETTRALYDLGVREMGENRPDKLIEKMTALGDLEEDIAWHFIGHLQTRQVKTIINRISYLHSLDRQSLIKEIQKRATQPVKCFLQVNVSGEASKGGFEPENVLETVTGLKDFDKIQLVGLMTMAPIDATEEALHRYFSELRTLRDLIQAEKWTWAPCQFLSMGMSRDYKIALQEGSNWIRVGTALFQSI